MIDPGVVQFLVVLGWIMGWLLIGSVFVTVCQITAPENSVNDEILFLTYFLWPILGIPMLFEAVSAHIRDRQLVAKKEIAQQQNIRDAEYRLREKEIVKAEKELDTFLNGGA